MSTRQNARTSNANKPRVLVLLPHQPHTGRDRFATEVEALEANYEFEVVVLRDPAQATDGKGNQLSVSNLNELVEVVRVFNPQILHAHYLATLPFVGRLSEMTGVPFTLRTHSSDTVGFRRMSMTSRMWRLISRMPPTRVQAKIGDDIRFIEDDLCLGVLSLPCARPWLLNAGIANDKLVDCFPLLSFARFHDAGPNGTSVMNMSAPDQRRTVDQFARLARRTPGLEFNIYGPPGRHHHSNRRRAYPDGVVRFVAPVEQRAMPSEYKRHRWLVYTADFDLPNVGWPVSIAEAQAAGVGVCVPNFRSDLADYVGEGAGVLYDSIDELPGIVSAPVPEEMRERAFVQARKSDIGEHKQVLTALWDNALEMRSRNLSSATATSVATSAEWPIF